MMSYGDPAWRDWILDEATAEPFVTRALEAGITTFDTADMYSRGVSEEITGRLLLKHARRDEVVIATKLFFRIRGGTNATGLSRKHVMEAIDGSLRRLGTDHVDLYQIHRWDPHTPIEETMEALHDVVKAGKARYLGASSMHAWQFAKAQHVATVNGWTRFVSMQDHYNLLYREEEREMLPQCRDMGVGVVPWSPLARGRLARPVDGPDTARATSDEYTSALYDDADDAIIDAVGEVAERHGVSRAQVALAWLLAQDGVTAPIVGATELSHLEDAIASVEVELSGDDLAALEAPYRPRPVLGHT
ncbi:MAG: aldo/keto reductase [Actinobacteria bacterium]|nr:aldo/keto reductase [Actinomycetota bacterium]